MESLAKLSKIPNWMAALVVFIAGYLSATSTTLVVTGFYQQVLSNTLVVFMCVLAFMFVVFVIAWRIRRTDLVDMAWGLAFIVAAVASFSINSYDLALGFNVQTIVTGLVILWGARLAFTIFLRLKSHPEDKRYVELRKTWKGNQALNTFFRIFFTQALLATVISIAVIHINLSVPRTPDVFAYIGVAIWVIGFLFEAIGDAQLKKFLANPANKGHLMTEGLWKFTRHPNYFGEATMWWGIFVIALNTEYGWVGIITPVVITTLLLFVSGVPLTEKAFEGKPGWDKYKKRTSKFFPLPPNRL